MQIADIAKGFGKLVIQGRVFHVNTPTKDISWIISKTIEYGKCPVSLGMENRFQAKCL